MRSGIIHNRWLPFKGFSAINLFGLIFVRKGVKMNCVLLNHEKIHTRQLWEMLVIPFYIWYFLEWLILLFQYHDRKKAYRNIRFEQEAYAHERDLDYLKYRKPYSWYRI